MRKLLLLLGADKYPRRPDLKLPAFQASHRAFKEAMLSGEEPLVAAEDCLDLFDSDEPWPSQQEAVDEWLRRVKGEGDEGEGHGLLVYYVGHGGIGPKGEEVFLTINSTNQLDPYHSSIPRNSLARLLQSTASDLRKFLIIDCCFAAAIVKNMMSPLPDRMTVELKEVGKTALKRNDRGLAALCASSSISSADAGGRDGLTQFTDGLLAALRSGDPASAGDLSFESMRDLIERQLLERYGPDAVAPSSYFPDDYFGAVHRLPLFPNRTKRRGAVELTTRPNPPDPEEEKNDRAWQRLEEGAVKIEEAYRASRQLTPQLLQKLAAPVRRAALGVVRFGPARAMLARVGDSPYRSAGLFVGSVVAYERRNEELFGDLLRCVESPQKLRGSSIWRALRAIKRHVAENRLTEQDRDGLRDALVNCAKLYDSQPGCRFKERDVLSFVSEIARSRYAGLMGDLPRIFNEDQLKEFEAARRRPPRRGV